MTGDGSELERRLDAMLASQTIDPELIQEILSLSPSDAAVDRIMAKLVDAGFDQGPSPAMNIEDYYRPGEGVFTLRWPLSGPTASLLPMPFEQLDRKSQFFVLFGEWTRRELEGNMARDGGDLPGARSIFGECLQRAEQLGVAELEARSHEGLMSIAEREGDRRGIRAELDAAIAARERAQP
jgi:hypothetical protein